MGDRVKANVPHKRPIQAVTIGVAIVFVLLIAVLTSHISAPKRSIASYCQTYKTEKTRLAKLSGNTYSSAIFDNSINDAGEFAKSFAKLEKAAPDEVRPDVSALQDIYQKIHDDPSQATSASLSGLSAENSVRSWTTAHCH